MMTSYSKSQQLDKEVIQGFANNLLISKAYNAKINKTLPIVDNIQVVVLEPSYREFPSVILLKKDSRGKWNRVFECLSPGIQDMPSGLLDWHTKGCGVDFEVNNDSVYEFHSEVVNALIESSLDKKGGVIIAYQNFIHMNTADSSEQKYFEPYTIDKTNYYDFANKLMDNKYENYSAKECIMFDTPQTIDCSFENDNGEYKLITKTNNNQTWIYTFKNIDSELKYLIDKKIEVKNTH